MPTNLKVWMITNDKLGILGSTSSPNQSGTWGGPKGCSVRKNGKTISSTHDGLTDCPLHLGEMPVKFRFKDDDGEVYYEGVMSKALADSPDILMPLDDFAEPNAGCTSMDVWEKGAWKPV